MRSGTLKKLILISFIFLFLFTNKVITKGKLYMFTDIEKCKSCNNEILNALNSYSSLFDSLNINYELILRCRRSRDTEDYRHYFKLDSNLRIVRLTDSLENLYKPENTEGSFVLTHNDTITFTTKSLYLLVGYLTK